MHVEFYRAIALTLVLIIGAVLLDFRARTMSNYHPDDDTAIGVVFTGQYVRVYQGLALLKKDIVEPLFISGVNRPAGMTTENFSTKFELDESLLDDLTDGRLILGDRAHSTFENALEVRCWLEKIDADPSLDDLPVVLITSSLHMPRASVALERALRGREVYRWSIPESLDPKQEPGREFMKYLATRAYYIGQSLQGAWYRATGQAGKLPARRFCTEAEVAQVQ